MNLDARSWLIALLLGLMAMSPVSAQVSLTPGRDKEIEDLVIKGNKGDASAQFYLGIHYSASKNYSQAVYWYRKAAAQGWSVAYGELGECYEWGHGVDKDMTEAVSWYRKAADKGDSTSIYRLGKCYFEGLGVEKNYETAVYWFRRAADSGNPTAQRSLGDCYLKGLGVAQSKLRAQMLYSQSFLYFYKKLGESTAVFEDAPIRYMVGMHYENGLGMPLDPIEAYAYYASMAELSDDRSKAALIRLETILSKQDIAVGQKRTRELQKEIEAKQVAKGARK